MREALLMNLKGFSASDLQKTIDEGIASKEETILIGLGVLFEEYYNSLDNSLDNNFFKVCLLYFRPDSGLFFILFNSLCVQVKSSGVLFHISLIILKLINTNKKHKLY